MICKVCGLPVREKNGVFYHDIVESLSASVSDSTLSFRKHYVSPGIDYVQVSTIAREVSDASGSAPAI